jgi:hypothetical protein
MLSLNGMDERLKILTERSLRPLVQIRDPDAQKKEFAKMAGLTLRI